MTRKDGRELYFDHPLTGEDLVEVSLDPTPPDAGTRCRPFRRDNEEAWMWDDA